MAQGKQYHDGPVCYVGEDGSATDINGELCDGGWHYTVVVDEELKKLAIDAAEAEVALWEKRAGRKGVGRFAQAHLDTARDNLAAVREASFEVPGEKLHLEDTEGGEESRFRAATSKDDRSWHDRKHQDFATFQLEDQSDGIRVNPEELDFLQRALAEFRQGKGGPSGQNGGQN
jgi:hypothetical protein